MQSYIVRMDSTSAKDLQRQMIPQEESNETQKSSRKRIKHWIRIILTFLLGHVGVGALLVLYTILGATIFLAIESPVSDNTVAVEKFRNATVFQLWEATQNWNVIYAEKWESEVDQIVRNFQNEFLLLVKAGYAGMAMEEERWTFPKAVMYSLSVYTTIGNNNLTPKTEGGKIFTCLYALAGIPLLLLYMTNIGNLLAQSFIEFYLSLDRCHERIAAARKPEVRKPDPKDNLATQDKLPTKTTPKPSHHDATKKSPISKSVVANTVPISTCLTLFLMYILLGSAVFSAWEGWGLVDGAYSCFVALVTIGFGELGTGGHGGFRGRWVDGQLVILSIYILLGMGIISMLFHLTQERFFTMAKKLGKVLHMI